MTGLNDSSLFLPPRPNVSSQFQTFSQEAYAMNAPKQPVAEQSEPSAASCPKPTFTGKLREKMKTANQDCFVWQAS
jgi:hypothetical protein